MAEFGIASNLSSLGLRGVVGLELEVADWLWVAWGSFGRVCLNSWSHVKVSSERTTPH